MAIFYPATDANGPHWGAVPADAICPDGRHKISLQSVRPSEYPTEIGAGEAAYGP